MNIAIIGPSGVGKGTHAGQLSAMFGFELLATGQLFRQHLRNETDLGRAASVYIRHGELVPEEIVEAMLADRLAGAPRPLLLDGVPRTAEQAEFVDRQLAMAGSALDLVIYLDAPENVLIARLLARRACGSCPATFDEQAHPAAVAGRCDACGGPLIHRDEDIPDLIQTRLEHFRMTAGAVVSHYHDQGRLVIIRADQPLEAVHNAILTAIDRCRSGLAPAAADSEVDLLLVRMQHDTIATEDLAANYVLLGGPGCGKGTQAVGLSDHLHIPHISTGDIFRRNLQQETPLGTLAKRYMTRGELVPDDVTEAMVRGRLREPDAQSGFLLDGFPRNRSQARSLTRMLAERGGQLRAVIYIAVSDEEIIRRLSGRLTCRSCQASFHRVFRPPAAEGICDACGGELYQRPDDNPESIRARLKTFHQQTAPVVEYYRDAGILIQIQGEGPSAEIARAILDVLRTKS